MTDLTRREALAGLCALAAGPAFAKDSDFPSRPIEIVVPATPGGAADRGARLIETMLRGPLGQPIVVNNRTGAGGSIAAAYVARSEKNGYVVGMASDSSVLINPLVMADLKYRLEDFQLLTPLYMGPMALAVANDFPARNTREFIAEANKRGTLSCAMFGVASSPRIAAEMFMAEAGIRLNPVPYRGESEAVMDLLGGSVPAYFGTTAQLVEQHRAGKLRIIATTFTERLKIFPDVPTFQEEGLKKVVYRWFHGLMLPAGTPQAIVDRYVKELKPIVTSDRFRDGISPDLVPVSMSPSEFTDMALAARERVAIIIRDRDLKGKA